MRVYAIAPGPIETAMLDRPTGGAERKAAFAAGLPMQRLGRAEEVADAIRFIASNQAGFITGEIIHVNGGKTPSTPPQHCRIIAMSTLSGKTALLNGASRGIGRSIALVLAKQGAQVLVHYSSAAAEAEAVVAEIRALGGRAQALGADLSTPDAPHQLAATVLNVAGAIAFLASDAARWVSGDTLRVDGGSTL